MSDEKKTTEKETKSTVSKTAAETKFDLYELRAHSKELFGVKPEVFDGAMSKVKVTQMTKTEAKQRISQMLKKGVKQ
ncbi:hypothetical protein [Jeotgalibacillus malaysiensis]|uniref:hypothetical protein n=1 Tax=Jeotgalibacillus malaysiensis TaxID=1508404 RepID=UPI00384E3ABB